MSLKDAGDLLSRFKNQETLLLEEAMELITHYGFAIPPHRMATSLDEYLKAWRALNGPVAMTRGLSLHGAGPDPDS